jgi:pyrroline-5-carboxylate reductase
MKQICTIFCVILSTLFASAQDRYLPGKIILPSKESKEVEIFYEDWSASPQQIKVKENGVIIAYKPEQLKGFEIPSLEKSYISEKLTLNFTAQIPITSYSELFTETKTDFFS